MTSPCDIDSFDDCSALFSVLKYNVNYFHSFLNDDIYVRTRQENAIRNGFCLCKISICQIT